MRPRAFLPRIGALVILVLMSPGFQLTTAASASAAEKPTPQSSPEPLFDGLGKLHHPVSTKSPLAQRYFDQGLTLVYAFNHDEACASFKEAARQDPGLAMAYWGVALALGPNINLPEDTKRGRAAYAAIKQAQSLFGSASDAERGYIAALALRYGADGKMDDARQRAYADAMRELAHRYPDDPDAGALFAESMMDLHPWNLWTADGKPIAGTLELVAELEAVLARHPDHIGANHYYIHAVEGSNNPGRALPSAARLANLAPAAGHLVHMPAHIYFRTGDYPASVAANTRAVRADEAYLTRYHPSGVYPMMYYPHNVQFLWAAYMMEGNHAGAAEASRQLAKGVTPEMVEQMPVMEFLAPANYLTAARFRKWDEILAAPAPPANLAYTSGVWHYARGLALAAKSRLDDADAERTQLDKIVAATPPSRIVGQNSAKLLLEVASATLAGEIAAARGRHDDAINHYRDAVKRQDSLSYEEPPPWYYPVRQTLGMELISRGQIAAAEETFREDLKQYPENGYSLNGLAICLRAQGKNDEAAGVAARLKKAWAHADVKLPAVDAAAKTAAAH